MDRKFHYFQNPYDYANKLIESRQTWNMSNPFRKKTNQIKQDNVLFELRKNTRFMDAKFTSKSLTNKISLI